MSEETSAFSCVLDASALLALLNDEPGGQEVEHLLAEAAISSVNWSEVVQKSLARGVGMEGLREDMEALGLLIVPFGFEDAERAAALWSKTTQAGLSLGDRACLALASRLSLPVLTADRAWSSLQDLDISVRVIREGNTLAQAPESSNSRA